MESILNDPRPRECAQAQRCLPHEQEYYELTPYAGTRGDRGLLRKPQLDGQNLVIYGKQFGNIGVQPSFGCEGDPMRLLFASPPVPITDSLPTTLSSRRFSRLMPSCISEPIGLEFMPGKQVGMSGNCYPDRLIGSLPTFTPPTTSEATIMRRSYAATVSYLTPPAETLVSTG
jgi:magnesium chelatase subunit H